LISINSCGNASPDTPTSVTAGRYLAARRLRQVLPGLDAGDVKIFALYPTRRLLEPRVRRFIDLMAEELPR